MKFSDEDTHEAESSFMANTSLLSRLSHHSSFIGTHKFNVNIQLMDDKKTISALFKVSFMIIFL